MHATQQGVIRMEYGQLKQSFIHYLESDHLIVELKNSYIRLEESEEPEEPEEPEEIHSLSVNPDMLPLSVPTPLEEILESAKRSVSLGKYIRQKAHRSNMLSYRPALFEQAQISRDYWSRLLNDEVNASKEKLLRVAILLKLNSAETEDLLEKAGYSLSQTILRDVVVTYCLEHRIYDFVSIEALLADHDVQSLFNDRRGVKY